MGIMDAIRRTNNRAVDPSIPHDFGALTLPSNDVLSALDEAQERGFRAFLSDIGHSERNEADLRRASDALIALENGVRGLGPDVDYDDPYTAAAYLVKYHLGHCILAYWSFKGFFDQFAVPDALYVCDVRAGTGSARVGLAMALSERVQFPTVYFDVVEPSEAMRSAGNCFWKSLQEELTDIPDCAYRESGTVPEKMSVELLNDAFRMVTAFHLSLPYDNRPRDDVLTKSELSLQSACRLVSPDIGLFTCNKSLS